MSKRSNKSLPPSSKYTKKTPASKYSKKTPNAGGMATTNAAGGSQKSIEDVYEGADNSTSIRSDQAKKIPFQRVTQRLDGKGGREDDDYTYEDPYHRTQRLKSLMKSQGIDPKKKGKRRRGGGGGTVAGSHHGRRLIRSGCFYVSCSISLFVLLLGLLGLLIGTGILFKHIVRMEADVELLRCDAIDQFSSASYSSPSSSKSARGSSNERIGSSSSTDSSTSDGLATENSG